MRQILTIIISVFYAFSLCYADPNVLHGAIKHLPVQHNLKIKKVNYVIGYGSLLETRSRRRTNPDAKTIHPIIVCGFTRGWIYRPTGIFSKFYKLSTLGVTKAKRDDCFNAGYFAVNRQQLKQRDNREFNYQRIQIPREQLKNYSNKSLPKGIFWIYALPKEKIIFPDKDFPIIQSYVDRFLNGCIEIEQENQIPNFAEQCILSTNGWQTSYWINDRIYPRRPFEYQPNALTIDLLLAKHLKHYPVDNDKIS